MKPLNDESSQQVTPCTRPFSVSRSSANAGTALVWLTLDTEVINQELIATGASIETGDWLGYVRGAGVDYGGHLVIGYRCLLPSVICLM